jgi:GTP-binding protein Era
VSLPPAPAERRARAGKVALVGWTNVGKSTLLNRLVGEKIAAVASVAQTTRNPITGVRNVAGRGQIVFVDTPGLHRPRYKMNREMVRQARQTVYGVDLVLLMIDAQRGIGSGDREAAELLRGADVDRLMVLNKIDRVRPKSKLLPLMQSAVEQWSFPEVLPVSALTGDGCDVLLDRILARLPAGAPLFPDDYLTDQTERKLAAESIREKLLALMGDELPHATAVLTEAWRERPDGLVEIEATIFVDRDSQKQIVIGRGGQLLKQVGTEARQELEVFLNRRIFMRLWVKVRKNWRDDEHTLRELGFGD